MGFLIKGILDLNPTTTKIVMKIVQSEWRNQSGTLHITFIRVELFVVLLVWISRWLFLSVLQIPWGRASTIAYAVLPPPVLLTGVSRQCVKSVRWNGASQMAQVKVLGFGKLGAYHSNEIGIR